MIYVVDTETTGEKPPEAAVCEIASVPVTLDGRVVLSKTRSSLINPGHAVPCEARAVHHLGDVDLAKAKPFAQVMQRQFAHLRNSIIAAHNLPFDWQFLEPALAGEERRLCTYKLAKHLYPTAPNHKNQTLRYYLDVDPPKAALKGLAPHRALYDAICTAFILARMIKEHGTDHLLYLMDQPVLLTTCHLRAHKGKPWADVPHDYLRWILRTPDFDPDVRYTAQFHLGLVLHHGRSPAQQAAE